VLVLAHEVDDTLRDAPFEKIQLRERGFDGVVGVRDVIRDLGCPTEWIEQAFAVPIEA